MSDWLGDIGSWFGDNAKWLAPTAIAAGSAIYGANANSNAAQTQANALQQGAATQTATANNALALQRDMFNQGMGFQQQGYNDARADGAPYRQAGQNALGTYAAQLGTQYQESPGYQFQFNEGQRAVQNSAAAKGMLNSGATAKALTRYGQGVANQDYGNWMNRQASLAGIGQTAAGQGAQLAQNFGQGAATMAGNYGNAAAGITTGLGNSLAQNYGQQGNVLANGQTAGANAYMSGANSLLGYFGSNSRGIFG